MNFHTGFDDQLVAVSIIERDFNDDVMLTWCFPSLDEEMKERITDHTNLSQKEIKLKFKYNNFNGKWVYLWTRFAEKEAALASVKAYSVCVVTKTFNPEKYAAVVELLSNIYYGTGSPPEVLAAYLSVFRRGAYEGALGEFSDTRFDPRRALLATSIKDITRLFGENVVLLWTALMMKKRVAVLSEKLAMLLLLIRGFPVFVWHRQDWSILRPHVNLNNAAEFKQLQAAGVFCAGFTDPAIKAMSNTWDLLVDVNARQVIVAEHAQHDFELVGFQRGLAKFLLEAAENPDVTPQAFIKGLAGKTKELLQKLSSLRVPDAADGNQLYITMEGLQNVKLPPKMDRFLFSIAAAEGLTKATSRKQSTSSSSEAAPSAASSSSSEQ